MDTNTGRFEEVEAVMEEARKKQGWKMYEPGEIVDFKDWAFEIVSIDTVMQRIVLKPLTPEQKSAHFGEKSVGDVYISR